MELKPSEIFYSQDSIRNRFNDNTGHRCLFIGETLDQLLTRKCSIADIPRICVIKKTDRMLDCTKWFTVDNRRLWVFRKAEEIGFLEKIQVERTSYIKPKKFTTVNDGTSIRVRGGDPGGKIWRTWKQPATRVSNYNINALASTSHISKSTPAFRQNLYINTLDSSVQEQSVGSVSYNTGNSTNSRLSLVSDNQNEGYRKASTFSNYNRNISVEDTTNSHIDRHLYNTILSNSDFNSPRNESEAVKRIQTKQTSQVSNDVYKSKAVPELSYKVKTNRATRTVLSNDSYSTEHVPETHSARLKEKENIQQSKYAYSSNKEDASPYQSLRNEDVSQIELQETHGSRHLLDILRDKWNRKGIQTSVSNDAYIFENYREIINKNSFDENISVFQGSDASRSPIEREKPKSTSSSSPKTTYLSRDRREAPRSTTSDRHSHMLVSDGRDLPRAISVELPVGSEKQTSISTSSSKDAYVSRSMQEVPCKTGGGKPSLMLVSKRRNLPRAISFTSISPIESEEQTSISTASSKVEYVSGNKREAPSKTKSDRYSHKLLSEGRNLYRYLTSASTSPGDHENQTNTSTPSPIVKYVSRDKPKALKESRSVRYSDIVESESWDSLSADNVDSRSPVVYDNTTIISTSTSKSSYPREDKQEASRNTRSGISMKSEKQPSISTTSTQAEYAARNQREAPSKTTSDRYSHKLGSEDRDSPRLSSSASGSTLDNENKTSILTPSPKVTYVSRGNPKALNETKSDRYSQMVEPEGWCFRRDDNVRFRSPVVNDNKTNLFSSTSKSAYPRGDKQEVSGNTKIGKPSHLFVSKGIDLPRAISVASISSEKSEKQPSIYTTVKKAEYATRNQRETQSKTTSNRYSHQLVSEGRDLPRFSSSASGSSVDDENEKSIFKPSPKVTYVSRDKTKAINETKSDRYSQMVEPEGWCFRRDDNIESRTTAVNENKASISTLSSGSAYQSGDKQDASRNIRSDIHSHILVSEGKDLPRAISVASISPVESEKQPSISTTSLIAEYLSRNKREAPSKTRSNIHSHKLESEGGDLSRYLTSASRSPVVNENKTSISTSPSKSAYPKGDKKQSSISTRRGIHSHMLISEGSDVPRDISVSSISSVKSVKQPSISTTSSIAEYVARNQREAPSKTTSDRYSHKLGSEGRDLPRFSSSTSGSSVDDENEKSIFKPSPKVTYVSRDKTKAINETKSDRYSQMVQPEGWCFRRDDNIESRTTAVNENKASISTLSSASAYQSGDKQDASRNTRSDIHSHILVSEGKDLPRAISVASISPVESEKQPSIYTTVKKAEYAARNQRETQSKTTSDRYSHRLVSDGRDLPRFSSSASGSSVDDENEKSIFKPSPKVTYVSRDKTKAINETKSDRYSQMVESEGWCFRRDDNIESRTTAVNENKASISTLSSESAYQSGDKQDASRNSRSDIHSHILVSEGKDLPRAISVASISPVESEKQPSISTTSLIAEYLSRNKREAPSKTRSNIHSHKLESEGGDLSRYLTSASRSPVVNENKTSISTSSSKSAYPKGDKKQSSISTRRGLHSHMLISGGSDVPRDISVASISSVKSEKQPSIPTISTQAKYVARNQREAPSKTTSDRYSHKLGSEGRDLPRFSSSTSGSSVDDENETSTFTPSPKITYVSRDKTKAINETKSDRYSQMEEPEGWCFRRDDNFESRSTVVNENKTSISTSSDKVTYLSGDKLKAQLNQK